MEASSPVLDFKSTTLYAVRVVLYTADTAAILAALDQRMADAAGFFDDEPVVIDASRLTDPVDWDPLLAALRRHRLPPIGVMVPDALADSARAAGLAQVSLPPLAAKLSSEAGAAAPSSATRIGGARTDAANGDAANADAPDAAAKADTLPAPTARKAVDVVADTGVAVSEPPASAGMAVATLIIDKPLRSGQKVYARHADLIVLGVVSHGAEVIADGNIHVYGPLRGKAMAGARGNTDARIFTTQFDAELIAVAGVYRSMTAALSPDIENKPATVRLTGDKLLVDPLDI
jgi:septum site-determining protein MinC